MKEKLKVAIEEVLKELALDTGGEVNFNVEHPSELSHGDYATNVAMILGKMIGKNPTEVSGEIVAKLEEKKLEEVSKIEIAGPGFINFTLAPKFFENSVKDILNQAETFGRNDSLKDQKTIVEYTDPNPFKEFHIGHLMSNTIGEAIARLAEANGAEVKRANWQGDIGLHVAKAVWGMKQNSASLPPFEDRREHKIDFLGKSYAFGSKQYEDDPTAKKEIISINKKLFEKSDPVLQKLYDIGRKWSLENFEYIYKVLGTKFDFYFFEGEESARGKKIVQDALAKGVFEESDGAVVYRGEADGLHTRVFINSEGLPTYEAKELGLAQAKAEKYSYDKSIVITGNEINEYFKVILSVMKKVSPDLAEKTTHISHGMLRMPEGKMSSRTGNVLSVRQILKDVSLRVEEKMVDRDFDKETVIGISEVVSVAALKYSILKQAPGKDVVFDFDKSLSFEGDSGPYLQYTYTRAKSLLEKAESEGVKTLNVSIPENWEVTNLEKLMYRMPEIVEKSFREYSPQLLVNFATQVASAFNSFYAQGQIVNKDDSDSNYKVALAESAKNVLESSLNILGMKVPEKM